jgi:F420-non-reducing hydrogenase iron-sulfur subunit
LAGVSRLQYAPEMRLIRFMCSGRVDLEHVLRAFSNGMDGVFVGGCRLNECNYATNGNHHAISMVLLCKKILEHLGLDPDRLTIRFIAGSEGNLFAETVNDFVGQVKELGPLGQREGIDEEGLKRKLQAAAKLVPYFRVAQNERLRVRFDTAEEYEEYYAGEEFKRLFNELVADRLAMSQIAMLLRDRPLSTAEIASALGLTPSEISRHLSSSAKQGLIRYEESQKRFALA